MDKKVLVTYFSCSGVTKGLAETLADAAGADLYEIKPEVAYTAADLNWNDTKSRSTLEMNDPASRPAIGDQVSNMDAYGVVFVGFPIWWNLAPRMVNTFLDSYDFSGKILVPFCTSGGSGSENSEKKLHECCPDSVSWRPGRLLDGRASKKTLTTWIDSLNL